MSFRYYRLFFLFIIPLFLFFRSACPSPRRTFPPLETRSSTSSGSGNRCAFKYSNSKLYSKTCGKFVRFQYARLALIFCMTMMYCLSCPLITPFGLLFFVTKHYVDRHNLLYAYKPSKSVSRKNNQSIKFKFNISNLKFPG